MSEVKVQPGAAGPYSIGSDHWPGSVKVQEECAELIQAISKMMGAGGDTGVHWDGNSILGKIQQEIGDVYAAIDFFLRHNPMVDRVAIREQFKAKSALFEGWHEDWSTRKEAG